LDKEEPSKYLKTLNLLPAYSYSRCHLIETHERTWNLTRRTRCCLLQRRCTSFYPAKSATCYSYLLGMEPVRSNRPTAIEKAWQTASRSFGWCPRQDHAMVNNQCPCFPYFVRPEYVRIEVAGEVVEVWLKSKPRGGLIGCDGFDRERIEKIVCEDVLSV
jgi:hypothetical protein